MWQILWQKNRRFWANRTDLHFNMSETRNNLVFYQVGVARNAGEQLYELYKPSAKLRKVLTKPNRIDIMMISNQ